MPTEQSQEIIARCLREVKPEQFRELTQKYESLIAHLLSLFAAKVSLPSSSLEAYKAMGDALFVIAYHLGEGEDVKKET